MRDLFMTILYAPTHIRDRPRGRRYDAIRGMPPSRNHAKQATPLVVVVTRCDEGSSRELRVTNEHPNLYVHLDGIDRSDPIRNAPPVSASSPRNSARLHFGCLPPLARAVSDPLHARRRSSSDHRIEQKVPETNYSEQPSTSAL